MKKVGVLSADAAHWRASLGGGHRWALGGTLLGALIGLVIWAPAAWLARAVAAASNDQLLLTDARGSVWHGDAQLVLTGGSGSRDARALPGRLDWSMSWRGLALDLSVRHACCLSQPLSLNLRPGFTGWSLRVAPTESAVLGHWPAAWLAGLGTPWNTLQLGGVLRVSARDLVVQRRSGQLTLSGEASLELLDAHSRLSTLPDLGSYRLRLQPDDRNTPTITLSTLANSALQLTGSGEWTALGLRFRGVGRADPASLSQLENLLNIIGRRDAASTVITIG